MSGMALGWTDILIRLGLATAAGAAVGFNRSRRGRVAGLRTMLLVCTGASLAMIVAQLASATPGAPDASRWAQGILAGMGFLGAGAIVRNGPLVSGVTTAATLWYTTILGLCFGTGYWSVGAAAFVIM